MEVGGVQEFLLPSVPLVYSEAFITPGCRVEWREKA